jgi:hypothetical protein
MEQNTTPETAEVVAINWNDMAPIDIVSNLDKMARSKGYIIIRDSISSRKVSEIREDTELYKLFQDIKKECKASFEYDHRMATMLDVNIGLTNVYSIVLKLIKASNSDVAERLDQICSAINTIEEKLGVTPTVWGGGTEDAGHGDGEVIQDGDGPTE